MRTCVEYDKSIGFVVFDNGGTIVVEPSKSETERAIKSTNQLIRLLATGRQRRSILFLSNIATTPHKAISKVLGCRHPSRGLINLTGQAVAQNFKDVTRSTYTKKPSCWPPSVVNSTLMAPGERFL